MLKSIAKLLLASLLSVTLIIPNTLAFHKNVNFEKKRETIPSSDNRSKKELQIDYCTVEVQDLKKKGKTKEIDKEKDDKKKEPLSEEEKKYEEKAKKEKEKDKKENGISSELVSAKDIFTIKHYHTEKTELADKYLDFTTLKNYKLPNGGGLIGYDKTTIQEVLEYYCLQVSPESNKDKKFKVSTANGLVKLYNIIASINGLDDRKSKINKRIYDEAIIYLPINDYKLIYAEAQFIINEEDRLRIEADKKKAADEAKAEETRIANELKENRNNGNKQWLSENKQDFIDQFNKKLDEYKSVIKELTKKRNKLITKTSDFKTIISETKDLVDIAIDDLENTTNPEIKDLRTEIRKNKKIYLLDSDLKQYQSDLKIITKINFEKYKRYETLKDLIKRASKSKKAANFVGKDGITVLGIKFTQNKIGYIQEFRNIKDKDLASGSAEDEKDIDKLHNDIDKHIENINEYILNPVEKLTTLDNAIGNKTPWEKYAIYFVIFLVVVGVIVYVVIQQNNLKRIRRESEEKVGSLKSDFENKLKDTSEQIKSVSRTAAAARSQQIDTSSAPEPVEEIPKTAEEIVAEKYNELLSDYKEALDDFTKVAVFKQKWHGLPLSRKERQDGSKTILVSSTRAFEKAGIWCVTVGDKYYAFPGSTVKSNMATYMNMDFMKAGQDFKGVFAISTGSTYVTEPAMLRRGGVGFVVEGAGKIAFPD
jgi:hypothetical protein